MKYGLSIHGVTIMPGLGLLIAVLVTGFSAAYAGTASGGGGGGFCFPDRHCITLAEAGLKIKEDVGTKTPERFNLKPELLKVIRETVDKMPWVENKENIVRGSIGELNTFRLVEKLDKNRFEKAYREYQAVLKKHAPNLDPKYLVFYAYSDSPKNIDDSITYLLPDFLNLSPRDQALTLIHENRRRAGYDLVQVLKFDIQFSNFLDALDTGTADKFDVFRLVYYANTLKWVNDSSLPIYAVEKIERESGHILTFDELLENCVNPLGYMQRTECKPSREALINLSVYDSRIQEVFAQADVVHMDDGNYRLDRPDVLEKCKNAPDGASIIIRVNSMQMGWNGEWAAGAYCHQTYNAATSYSKDSVGVNTIQNLDYTPLLRD